MCFGGSSAPQIVYSGPSAQDIEQQNQQLQLYMQQSATQQQQFAQSLQQQIDEANAESERQRQQLDRERQAASADMTAQQQSAYAVTATTTEPVGAMTTEAPKVKEKRRDTLRITPGSVQTTAGTGLNIGV